MYRVGVWFGFVGSALLLAVVLGWVAGLTLLSPCNTEGPRQAVNTSVLCPTTPATLRTPSHRHHKKCYLQQFVGLVASVTYSNSLRCCTRVLWSGLQLVMSETWS